MGTGSDTGWVNSTYPVDGPDAERKNDDAWVGFVDTTCAVSATAGS